jgi:hypothetical protein
MKRFALMCTAVVLGSSSSALEAFSGAKTKSFQGALGLMLFF